MTSRSLGYESQKFILQYLEPNLRIQLSLRCPSLRFTDKLIPLQIDHLSFGNMRTEVNGTTYQLGVYRSYPSDVTIPHLHSQANEEGGSILDLDRFGVEDQYSSHTLTPGDVDIHSRYRLSLTPGQWQAHLENRLNWGVLKLSNISEHHGALRSKWELRNADVRTELQSFTRRRYNVDAPFTCYIQLTVHSAMGTTIERVEYSKKLPEALKYLNTVLIGGRSQEVHVNQLSLLTNTNIYRLPIGLKLKVNTIKSEVVQYQKLDSIINPLDYPTIDLHITKPLNFNHSYNQLAIHQAQSVHIDNDNLGLSYFGFLRDVQSKQVMLHRESDTSDYTRLVRNWLANGKPVGSIFTFGVTEEETVRTCLKLLKEENKVNLIRDQESWMTFAMLNRTAQLRVYYEKVLPQPERCDAKGIKNSCWNLIMKVEDI